MRRFLNELAGESKGLASSITRGWDRFVFTPSDPTPLGLIRVVSGMLLTWNLFAYGLDLPAFFGRTGWVNLEVVQAFRSEQMPASWSFWFYVPDPWLRPVWLVCLVASAAFTLGIASRWTAVLAWIIAASTARRVPIALYGFDDVLSTWLLYLAVSGASGQAASLDRFFARWKRNRLEVARRRKDGRWTAPAASPTRPSRPTSGSA